MGAFLRSHRVRADQRKPMPAPGVVLGLGALPVLLAAVFLLSGGAARGFDFAQFWQGGRDVLDGVSPYPSALPDPAVARALDPAGIQEAFRFPYPAPTALAMVPFALLPLAAATALLLALLVLAIPASLALLGVRDWRCYGAAFLWMPVLGSIRLGTLTPFLILGLAAAWRYRDRLFVVAGLVAAVVVAKIFLWPLLLWLAATRRTAAAALAAAAAVVVTVASWATIGFAGAADYPGLVRTLGDAVGPKSYSLAAAGAAAGLSSGVGTALGLAAGGVLIGAAVVVGRRGGDATALALVLGAAAACTPIVWLHYFALALVPVAISHRRLDAAWLVPLGFWITPYQESGGRLWAIVAGLAIFAVALTGVATPSFRRPSWKPRRSAIEALE